MRTVEESSSAKKWRAEATEQAERQRAERERENRARTARASHNWDAHVRGLIAEEHERMVDLLEQAFGEVVGDLWSDFREELKRAIKLAFLERPGFVPRVMGTWREGEKYEPLDVVARDGGLFMCKHSNPGECPGPDWQIMSTRGKRGEPGPIGLRGERGDMGPQGPPGAAILGWAIDRERFTITPMIRSADGGPPVSGPRLELRPLFEEYNRQVNGVVTVTADKATETPRREPAPLVQIVQGRPPESEEVG